MTTQPRSRKQKFTTKSAAVRQMLTRVKGASISDIMETTGWQNHSVRAFLTGLRKKGEQIVREESATGASVYRMIVQSDDGHESNDVAA